MPFLVALFGVRVCLFFCCACAAKFAASEILRGDPELNRFYLQSLWNGLFGTCRSSAATLMSHAPHWGLLELRRAILSPLGSKELLRHLGSLFGAL